MKYFILNEEISNDPLGRTYAEISNQQILEYTKIYNDN